MPVAIAFATAAWGVLAFGAVYPWAYWPLAAACLVAGATGIRAGTGGRDRPLVVAVAILAAAIALQLVPLPTALAQQVSPGIARLRGELDVAFAAGVRSSTPLTISPQATLTGLALFGALAVLLIGLSRSLTASTAGTLARGLAVLGLLVALVAIIQRPLFSGKIYGFWAPLMSREAFGPFVNKNHFAGWMAMALSLTLGLFFSQVAVGMRGVRPDWRSRIVWLSSPAANRLLLTGVAVLVMAVSLMLTLSRSGILALTVSALVTAAFAMRRLPGASRRAVVALYFVAFVAAIASWAGLETIVARFDSPDVTTFSGRVPIWQDTIAIVRDFWLTGTGLNTYGISTLVYQTSLPGLHLREAHSDYLQLAAEGGLLLVIPAAAVAVVFAVLTSRRFRQRQGSGYWLRLGAAGGVFALALQSVAEFSLQMPGNAVMFTILCAIALHQDRREARDEPREAAA